MIEAGRPLILAGAEQDLACLPPGLWIGGTVAGFLAPGGPRPVAGEIFYADLSNIALRVEVRQFGARQLRGLTAHYPPNGFAVLLLPGRSRLLETVATKMLDWDGLYNAPLCGWVSGVALEELGHKQPKIFCGGGTPRQDKAAVMYVTLPEGLFAELNIVAPFTQGEGPELRFPSGGYGGSGTGLLEGQRVNLARMIANGELDPALPLISDRDGALLTNAITASDTEAGTLCFLNPIDPALSYRFAEPIDDFPAAFAKAAQGVDLPGALLCSICIANLPRLDASIRPLLPAFAPITFGQIGYTVLTQTISCLNLSRLDGALTEQDTR